MPELPEVETIRRQLEKEVVGRTVKGVDVLFAKKLNVPAREFSAAITGKKMVSAGRRAKLLVLGFSGGRSVAVHLKMSGRFLLVPSGTAPAKHVRIVLRLSGGRDLHFEDMRKFGFLKLMRTDDVERTLFAGYGPEPLDPEFTAARFAMCMRGRGRTRIKPLLLDQGCVAGIGNIYADEALWRAKVRPTRSAGSLSDAEIAALRRGVVDSLRAALASRGTSADMYVDLYGRQGEYVPKLKVYGREGRPCARCRTPIRKMRLGGRGTHFCPKCQQ